MTTFEQRLEAGLVAEERVLAALKRCGLEVEWLQPGVNQADAMQNMTEGDIRVTTGSGKIYLDVKSSWSLSIKSVQAFTGQWFVLGGSRPETAVVVPAQVLKAYARKIDNPAKLPSGDPGFVLNPNTFRAQIPLSSWCGKLTEELATSSKRPVTPEALGSH